MNCRVGIVSSSYGGWQIIQGGRILGLPVDLFPYLFLVLWLPDIFY